MMIFKDNMGYSYSELIPPAILLDNPRITRKEFVRLLSNINASGPEYHKGLHGLASILRLHSNKKVKSTDIDEHGIPLSPPHFSVNSYRHNERWTPPKFKVVVHVRNEVEPVRRVKKGSSGRLKVGKDWVEEFIFPKEKGLVLAIFEETNLLPGISTGEYSPGSDGPRYLYDMKILPFRVLREKQEFDSLEELTTAWPQFDPNCMYEFSQKTGVFGTGTFGKNNFVWFQTNGRYYLDRTKTFNRIPASFNADIMSYGYTDLILTAEAIKHKVWKLLSSKKNKKYLEDFLRNFSDSFRRYEQAVWDSHTSLWAKKQEMTVYELLRMRIIGPNFDNRYKKQFTAPNPVTF